MTNLPRVLFALLLLLLGGCVSSGLEWEVTRSQELGPVQGKTFVVVPVLNDLSGSLEFKHYAATLAEKLTSFGLIQLPPEKIGACDYIVVLDYGIGPPPPPAPPVPSGDPYALPPGGYIVGRSPQQVTGQGLPITVPVRYTVETSDRENAGTNYQRFVRVTVHEGRINAEGTHTRIYRAMAQSVGPSQDLTWIVPNGIAALLTEFPGTNAKAKLVHITDQAQKP